MFKNIIAPVQAWLLSQGRCVGCGKELKNALRKALNKDEEKVTCRNCGRIYIYNLNKKTYQRAPINIPK